MLKKFILTLTILTLLLGLGIYAVFFKHLLPKEPRKYPDPIEATDLTKNDAVEVTPSAKVGAVTVMYGTITKMERPSPEIAYDYSISLDTPIYEEAPGGGRPVPVYSYILTTNNFSVNNDLQTNVGKKVKLTGEIEYGLAETRHFKVTKVENEITLDGTVNKMERPAPDIAYDYKIDLTALYHDNLFGGESGTYTESFPLVAANSSIQSQIKASVGKKVNITGVIEWGYAETRHFKVTKLEMDK